MAEIEDKKLSELKDRLQDAIQEAELVQKDLESSRQDLKRRVSQTLKTLR